MRTPASLVLFRESQREANACYANARARYNARCREKLASASSTRNWWSTLKESVLGIGSSIPSLQSDGGALVSDPAGKAAQLSNFFDGKQSRNVVGCPVSCHRRPKLCTFAFRSREVRRLLSEHDPHGGDDLLYSILS